MADLTVAIEPHEIHTIKVRLRASGDTVVEVVGGGVGITLDLSQEQTALLREKLGAVDHDDGCAALSAGWGGTGLEHEAGDLECDCVLSRVSA